MQGQRNALVQQLPTCPRCGTGNLIIHEEIDGPELRCFQCSAIVVIVEPRVAKRASVAG